MPGQPSPTTVLWSKLADGETHTVSLSSTGKKNMQAIQSSARNWGDRNGFATRIRVLSTARCEVTFLPRQGETYTFEDIPERPRENKLRHRLIMERVQHDKDYLRIQRDMYKYQGVKVHSNLLTRFANGVRTIPFEEGVALSALLDRYDAERRQHEEGTRPRNGNAYVTHAVQPGCRIKNFERPDQARERDEPRPEGRRDQAPVRST